MGALLKLSNLNDGFVDEVKIDEIENRNCFTYLDNDGSNCEICIYEDGLCLFKQTSDHLLELHLKDNTYAKVTTSEGIIKFDAKVIDFHVNNDILVMHYLVNEEERIIEINY